MADTVLQIKDLCKIYKTRNGNVVANDNISFSVYRGELVAFLGPNGSGKTTLIKQIIGYTTSTSGKIELFGDSVDKHRAKNLGRIGYMMQSRYAHWDHLSAWDAMFYSGRLKNLTKTEIKTQIESLIVPLNLEKDLKVVLETMSGGKKQAVALACAVIGHPELLILDEPTNGLDPEMRRCFWDFIGQLSASRHMTILLVTHNVNEIEAIADEIKIFSCARIIREGNPREMIKELNEKIRVELTVKEGCKVNREHFMETYEKKWSKDTLFIYVEQKDIVRCVKDVFSNKDVYASIENIQMGQPNLEDVYIRLVGDKIE
jgi:ABC-type multidrug transport system ATPase subunit